MADTTRILITGGQGQVGTELRQLDWPAGMDIVAPDRQALDLSDITAVRAYFAANAFDAVIHPAAYTAVDKAETEIAEAFAVNALTPALLAELTKSAGIPLVHVSTDYVFDGEAEGPYTEDHPTAPANVYGASKRAGELAVLAGNPRSAIVRTAWVFSAHRANFVKTMIRLASERSELKVVEDQHGCPTSARDVACALATITLRMIEDTSAPSGIFHFANEGSTSWAGLAREIMASLPDGGVPVLSITTSDYPTPARRPANSCLDTRRIREDYAITPRKWQIAVQETVAELTAKRILE